MRSLGRPQQPLIGRHGETRLIEELIGAARAGQGGVLVLRGEAGIGKSALLEHTREAVTGFLVVHATGSQFESELPFAALHQLCRPLCTPSLGYLAELSPRHQEVLDIAFGKLTGTPDLVHVGLAALELMATAARHQPLLCLIDDAHWLDTESARVLAFIARRIDTDPVAMLMSARIAEPAHELDELPALTVDRLSEADARALLASARQTPLDDRVRERIVAEASGNPLALLQLPDLGAFALPDTSSVPTRIELSFQAKLADLPDAARLLLTVASADPTGDPVLLWAAAERLGIDVAATSAAVAGTGLVEFSTRIRFHHPLARSAVYLAADDAQRRTAHRVLAEVTDPELDPDRRAWHRAEAATGPDEDVAEELERSAERARARGGMSAAAAFLERAAELSLDAVKRVERTLDAARAKFDVGAFDVADTLLTTIENTGLDMCQRSHCDLLRGRVAFIRYHYEDGPNFMLRAGRRLAEWDPEWSRECFVDALAMSVVAGRPSGVLELILDAAMTSAPPSPKPDVLDALITLSAKGYRAAAPLLRKVLHGDGEPLWATRHALAVEIAAALWDPHSHAAIAESLVREGRESGSPIALRLALAELASAAAMTGDVGKAMAAIAEESAIADATGGRPVYYHQLRLAAIRGRRQEATELIDQAMAAARERGTDQLTANVHWAAAVLHNGLAEYQAALTAARNAVDYGDLFLSGFALPELVEAAVRSGERDEAARALESLTERADGGTETILGVTAYARGLVTGAEDDYREAIELLEASPLVPYRARANLLYGEWLRRENRRKECRQQLRIAHDLLTQSGMDAFAQRASVELQATGENARTRSEHAHNQLTMQEMHIARLVATGATSTEVAARLFISHRTVDTHLRNVFRKLEITSRKQLKNLPGLRVGS
ncbi:AAA family ATPase [Amycolatopsis sp. cg5]|uniref:helix-turn-helix transcriptional regulator n=1 Tax=Amycolatopsis sp. cg5 TaxID=3238802 RepID=UPI0035249B8F